MSHTNTKGGIKGEELSDVVCVVVRYFGTFEDFVSCFLDPRSIGAKN